MPEFTDPTATAHDEDLDALALGEVASDVDDLDDELAQLDDSTIVLEVPRRPAYGIRCRTDFTGRDLDLIRQKCRDKKFTSGIDGVKLSALLIAANTIAIVRNGVDLELDGEAPITFVSKPFQKRMGTATADATVRAFYGLEGHVDAAGDRLLAEAGWGDSVYTVDPQ